MPQSTTQPSVAVLPSGDEDQYSINLNRAIATAVQLLGDEADSLLFGEELSTATSQSDVRNTPNQLPGNQQQRLQLTFVPTQEVVPPEVLPSTSEQDQYTNDLNRAIAAAVQILGDKADSLIFGDGLPTATSHQSDVLNTPSQLPGIQQRRLRLSNVPLEETVPSEVTPSISEQDQYTIDLNRAIAQAEEIIGDKADALIFGESSSRPPTRVVRGIRGRTGRRRGRKRLTSFDREINALANDVHGLERDYGVDNDRQYQLVKWRTTNELISSLLAASRRARQQEMYNNAEDYLQMSSHEELPVLSQADLDVNIPQTSQRK